MRRLLFLLALALPRAVHAQCTETCIDTLALRAHTRFLADDELAGRGAGTDGERIASLYIASQLAQLGLGPLGDDYLLPVPLVAARVLPSTRLHLYFHENAPLDFQHGRDFLVNTGSARAFHDFEGYAMFVGSPENALRSLARIDVRDRVIVVDGTLGAAAEALVPAWRDGGAAGIVLLVPDPGQFHLYVRSRGPDRFYVEADVDDPIWQPDLPVLIAGPSLTRMLLEDEPIPAAALQGEPFDPVPLGRRMIVDVEVETRDVATFNVAGLIRGSDPVLRDEVVLFTAHHDHLGISTPDASGDSIYNGFSDNAAGVAMLLTVAKALRDDPPRRSVAFAFFAAEERGLLGSSYFAARPPIPLDRIAAVINLDAGAPPAPPVSWRIAGGETSSAGAAAEDVARRHGWSANLGEASPNSDYWSFLARDVPALFIIPGPEWENVTQAEQDALRSRWDRYHQPGDHYDDAFPFAGLQRYAGYALEVGLEIADADRRPTLHH